MDSGLQDYVPDWIRGLIGANVPFSGPREPKIGVDPHPRNIDVIRNDSEPGGLIDQRGGMMLSEMPFGPGGIGNAGKAVEGALEGAGKAGRALKDVAGSAVGGLKTAAEKAGRSIPESRWSELMGKFGGKGQ